jgi:hypothetical protein
MPRNEGGGPAWASAQTRDGTLDARRGGDDEAGSGDNQDIGTGKLDNSLGDEDGAFTDVEDTQPQPGHGTQ